MEPLTTSSRCRQPEIIKSAKGIPWASLSDHSPLLARNRHGERSPQQLSRGGKEAVSIAKVGPMTPKRRTPLPLSPADLSKDRWFAVPAPTAAMPERAAAAIHSQRDRDLRSHPISPKSTYLILDHRNNRLLPATYPKATHSRRAKQPGIQRKRWHSITRINTSNRPTLRSNIYTFTNRSTTRHAYCFPSQLLLPSVGWCFSASTQNQTSWHFTKQHMPTFSQVSPHICHLSSHGSQQTHQRLTVKDYFSFMRWAIKFWKGSGGGWLCRDAWKVINKPWRIFLAGNKTFYDGYMAHRETAGSN